MLFSTARDLRADALYITLTSSSVARTVEFDSGTLVDVDDDGQPVGIEVIHPARQWPVEAIIDRFGFSGREATQLRLLAESVHAPAPTFGRLRKKSTGSGNVMRTIRAAAI
jgi:uncharacterized protein YuzE